MEQTYSGNYRDGGYFNGLQEAFCLKDIPSAEIFIPSNVNHVLREIDDDNSVMTVKKQYSRL